jgi:hypothetical protein
MTSTFRPPHYWSTTVILLVLSPVFLLLFAAAFVVLAGQDLGSRLLAFGRERGESGR